LRTRSDLNTERSEVFNISEGLMKVSWRFSESKWIW